MAAKINKKIQVTQNNILNNSFEVRLDHIKKVINIYSEQKLLISMHKTEFQNLVLNIKNHIL